MSTRKELINGGLYMQEAVATGGSTDLGVTVTTGMTTQANAYAIKSSNTVVTTSGASGNALVLPVTDQGDWLQVANFTANTINIFPPTGWGIHTQGQNASYPLVANKTATFTTVTDPNKALPQGGLTFHQVLAMQG